jgi:hypothetical protein
MLKTAERTGDIVAIAIGIIAIAFAIIVIGSVYERDSRLKAKQWNVHRIT